MGIKITENLAEKQNIHMSLNTLNEKMKQFDFFHADSLQFDDGLEYMYIQSKKPF